MVKQAVGLLQLLYIRIYLFCGTLNIHRIAGHPVCLSLEASDHPYIVNPETCLACQPVGQRILPLPVGQFQTLVQEFISHTLPVKLER